nr:hypothetical protein [Tanacetum cinerariifolium]GEW26179.1 hypothetical protein [Tanacetum cinerariifolium]
MNFLSASLTDRITKQVRNQLPQILPEEVSNFAPPVIKKIEESLNQVNLANVSSQPQSTYEAAATLIEFELKKILIDKMNSSELYLTALEHQECYDGLIKSYNLDKDFSSSYDVYSLKQSRQDKDKDEGPFVGSDRGFKKRKTKKDAEPTTYPKNKDLTSGSSKGTKKKSSSRRDWFTKPSRPQEPTDPDWNEDKTPQKGPTQNWLMTLVASTFTNKSLKDFDKLMSTPIDFYSYILNGLKIQNLTQEILLGPAFRLLKGTCSNYAELEYDFEECYKACSEKLDWEIVKANWLTNLSGDDVADFTIALRMFTRSLVIQKHPYIPYKDPQGFIYVDDYKRNRLMRSDEQYKFSDGMLTMLLSSLKGITKNIDMEYFPKRRWSTLEKKRAYFMIKDINKLLKERRMMRSLEKCFGGRLYETDLRLLQRTI